MVCPKVSIIIPVYKVEKFIHRCMNSVLNQTLKEIEIILVDDESPDNCPAICDEYSQKDKRVKVIHKNNAGLGLARNSAIDIATGEFIAFVDSDDYVDIKMYEKLYNQGKALGIDAMFCGFYKLNNQLQTSVVNEVNALKIFETAKDITDVLLGMIGTAPAYYKDRKYEMSVWHAIYSKSLIDKHNIRFHSEREFISEDILFHIDCLQNSKKIAFIPDPFYYYIENEKSLSKAYRADRLEKYKILHAEVSKRIKAISKNEEYQLFNDRLFIANLRVLVFQIAFKEMPFREKKFILKDLCADNIWNDIFYRFPIWKLPFKYSLVAVAIKYKLIYTMLLISKVKVALFSSRT